jgi:hypothetical protein
MPGYVQTQTLHGWIGPGPMYNNGWAVVSVGYQSSWWKKKKWSLVGDLWCGDNFDRVGVVSLHTVQIFPKIPACGLLLLKQNQSIQVLVVLVNIVRR